MWFVFCDEWSEYNIPDEELDDGPNAPLNFFSVYNYLGRCATHGIIKYIQRVWKICGKIMTWRMV